MKQKKMPALALAILLAVVLIGAGVLYRALAPGQSSDLSSLSSETPVSGSLPEDTGPSEADILEADRDIAPDFTVVDAEGATVSLSSLLDRPVILNFWATWCPPCRGELPEFQQAYETYGEQVRFLMVNLTDGVSETVDSVTEFVQENGYSFPVYFDTEGSAVQAYGLSAIPVTVAVGQDGRIVWSQVGAIDAETLEQVVQSLLSGTGEVQP